MADFTPTRSLLNPKFEGYKLLLLDQDDVVRRYNLPYKTTQASSYGKSPLTFQEVQSRITHNHFVPSAFKGRGIYVDTNHQVIVVDVADVRLCSFIRDVTHAMAIPLDRLLQILHSLLCTSSPRPSLLRKLI